MKNLTEGEKVRKMKFFPNFFMRDLVGWLLAIGALVVIYIASMTVVGYLT
ncbi:MAG: hypothetical protein M3444_03680 [Acidobacteriota bacterium]|nr:hypothetical protein [Acidobacteriota bacterium]MDQ5835554.1 hypothetical protein [Acidobacteriota bacterium]